VFTVVLAHFGVHVLLEITTVVVKRRLGSRVQARLDARIVLSGTVIERAEAGQQI
jgi:hypothetical protein